MGHVRVFVATTGGDIDNDGYEIVIDTVGRRIFPGAIAIVINATAGSHAVRIDSVAPNCTVSGDRTRSVAVGAGEVTDVRYDVACLATGVEIRTRATGESIPPSFDVLIDDKYTAVVNSNGSALITRLAARNYTIALVARSQNCTVATGREVTVSLTMGTVAPISFDVACTLVERQAKVAYVTDTLIGGTLSRWVMLMNPDGSASVPLANADDPSWSPDGTKLAFTLARCNDFDAYYGYICQGGLVTMDPERWSSVPIPGSDGAFNPSWTRSGNEIAFTRCCQYNERAQLFMLSPADGKLQSIKLPALAAARNPVFSPDERRILFTCIPLGSTASDVCAVNRDGTGFTRLTNDLLNEMNAEWSPDGTKIAFTRQPAGSLPLIIIADPDGSNQRTLTQGDDAAWMSNGTQLVFTGVDGIFRINLDGTQRTRLTKGNQRLPAPRP
jgi:hypothetical protein